MQLPSDAPIAVLRAADCSAPRWTRSGWFARAFQLVGNGHLFARYERAGSDARFATGRGRYQINATGPLQREFALVREGAGLVATLAAGWKFDGTIEIDGGRRLRLETAGLLGSACRIYDEADMLIALCRSGILRERRHVSLQPAFDSHPHGVLALAMALHLKLVAETRSGD